MAYKQIDDLKELYLFEQKVNDAVGELSSSGKDYHAMLMRELFIRYKTARITANNYKKALEALENAGKQ